MSKVLNVRGKVLPAANASVVLHAEMEDGRVVSGESTIPAYGQRIKRVFLTPEHIDPLPETIDVIRADLIIIGPKPLHKHSSQFACAKDRGRSGEGAGKKVYICNVMTQPGETLHYTAADHVKALNQHMGCGFIDTILVNSEDIPDEIKRKYEKESARPVDFDIEELKAMGLEVIRDQIVTYKNDVIRHDTHKVASLLVDLLKE